MTRPPLVALTTGVARKSGAHAQPSVFLYTNYVAALEACGLASVLITPAHTKESIDAIIDSCAGLVLTGGEDVDPARYGEAPSPALGTVSAERDEAETLALHAALVRDIPVFAICRGMQVLNVHLGGSLVQDLPSERPSDIAHVQPGGWSGHAHDVAVTSGSRLHDITGTDRFRTNSFHHQALNAIAAPLVVVARADDGTVEAVESNEHAWVLGVQWHPERFDAVDAAGAADAAHAEVHPDRALFNAFRDAVCATPAD
ncbi:MAG: gamma-glutamyl-gamma-aminobutyrate hydrolase family protein [Longimicrobiales bacterium]